MNPALVHYFFGSKDQLFLTVLTSSVLVRERIAPAVAGELADRLGVDADEAAARVALLASSLSGLVTTRYVFGIEPIAQAPIDWVVAAIGPTMQRYLTGFVPPTTQPGTIRRPPVRWCELIYRVPIQVGPSALTRHRARSYREVTAGTTMVEVTGMSVTQPLREEHQQLQPHIESLRAAAEAADDDPDTLRNTVDDALEFLHHHLIPHAHAEEVALYPKVEQVMHAPGATATMSRDHVEVMALTQQLQSLHDELNSTPTVHQRRNIQRVLYGLYAVVRLHFAKEEEIYLPLLDATLTPDDATDMFNAMHQATNPTGQHHHRQ